MLKVSRSNLLSARFGDAFHMAERKIAGPGTATSITNGLSATQPSSVSSRMRSLLGSLLRLLSAAPQLSSALEAPQQTLEMSQISYIGRRTGSRSHRGDGGVGKTACSLSNHASLRSELCCLLGSRGRHPRPPRIRCPERGQRDALGVSSRI
jgi:hypothetical protein